MVNYFFDTSALAKRYIREIGSEWVAEICEGGDAIFIAELTEIELAAAIYRRAKGGSLSGEAAEIAINDFDADRIDQYLTFEVNRTVLTTARVIVEKHALRGYDAVQLAVAIECDRAQSRQSLPGIHFVSADVDLLRAVKTEGLQTENPNDHK